MFRIAIISLIVAASVSSVGAAKIEFNVDFACGWDSYYRPMEWTPVEIGVDSDLTEPFAGTFTLSARQDGLNTLHVVRSFVLTPEVQQNLPMVSKIGFGMGTCDLAIRDARGRVQWEYSVEMWDQTSQVQLLRPIQEQDLLIGVIGQAQFGLLRLPRDAACVSDRGMGKVWVGRKVSHAVPRDWTGFVSLDVLVLYDPDWSLLHHESLQAIGEWVSNGGTLLLILGQHPLSRTNPLSEIVPVQIGEPRTHEIASDVLAQWALDSDSVESVTTWPLSPKPDALLTHQVRDTEGGYLYCLGCVGFGKVAVLSVDPSQLSDQQAGRTASFWVKQIGDCLEDGPGARVPASVRRSPTDRVTALIQSRLGRQIAGRKGRTIALSRDASIASGRRQDDRYRISVAQSAGNQVMEFLYQLSQMKPLSIWWVILILTMLALLLGPVDYFVLKRLDRLPYTWLTSMGWIVIFTVGAYYGVQTLRGGRMQLRAISVIDGIADSDCAWATYYTGLFAPRSADYRLEELGPRQWWSGMAPSQEQLSAYRREAAMRQIYCVQQDGGNLPVSVPINIWTVQSLLAEMPLEAMPFAIAVVPDGDGLKVELTNRSTCPILTGFVLLEEAFVDLPYVSPGATREFRAPKKPFNPWATTGPEPPKRVLPGRQFGSVATMMDFRYPKPLAGADFNPFYAQGTLDRTLAMHAYLRLGAALACVQFEKAPVPFGIENRSYDVTHIQLARQIVFPKDPQ